MQVRGFTLTEVLIVIVLLVTISAVMAPMLISSPTRQLRASASELAAGLRETRRLARAEQQRRRFTLNTRTGTFVSQNGREHQLSADGLKMALTTARSLLSNGNEGSIDFFPDGSSTGGRIDLSIEEWSTQIDIEWLTGRIRVREVGQ